jgi:hypothetical protein
MQQIHVTVALPVENHSVLYWYLKMSQFRASSNFWENPVKQGASIPDITMK